MAERGLQRGGRPVRDAARASRTSCSSRRTTRAARTRANGFKRYYKGKLADEIYTKLGQLDYAAELAQIRAAKPDALYVFLPGGMGINFIKQFVASGLSKDIQLVVPLWGSDEDIIRAVGEPMLGLFSLGHWTIDLDNPANKRFVAEFEKEYKRLPTGVRGAGLRHRAADRRRGPRREGQDRGQGGAAQGAQGRATSRACAATSSSTRNQFPVQNYYLRVVGKDAPTARITNKTIGTVLHQPRRRVRAGLQDEVGALRAIRKG